MNCILCGGESAHFYTDGKDQGRYFRCGTCDLRFKDPARRLSSTEERSRYLHHQNDATDSRYQEFMRPVLDLVRATPPETTEVLDFGCGAGPVFRHVLGPEGYQVALYDPFFYPERQVLESKYDFIAAVEVFEHLYDPGKELELLRSLLKPGGRLGLMTLFFAANIDFDRWYYRRDPTHVCFYSRETLGWIQNRFQFSELKIHSDRVAEFRT